MHSAINKDCILQQKSVNSPVGVLGLFSLQDWMGKSAAPTRGAEAGGLRIDSHANRKNVMTRLFRNDWSGYWARIDDPALLQKKSTNIDQTLREIEEELDIKLLSGDQMQVIEALEERLKEVSKRRKPVVSGQIDLFEI